MELSNPEVVKNLMEGTAPLYVAPEQPKSRRASTARRCECGRCAACLDNARWERIFRAKFADPDYYKQSQTRHGSSLYGLE